MQEYMTDNEAAAYIRKTKSYLQRCRVDGTGPKYIKLGRSVLYRRVDLEIWADAQARSSTSEPEAA
jgi:hypothetical protein